MFTITFAIQVHDWLIFVVWVGINQSRTRIVKDIINSENCYVIYLLYIIDIQKGFILATFCPLSKAVFQYKNMKCELFSFAFSSVIIISEGSIRTSHAITSLLKKRRKVWHMKHKTKTISKTLMFIFLSIRGGYQCRGAREGSREQEPVKKL